MQGRRVSPVLWEVSDDSRTGAFHRTHLRVQNGWDGRAMSMVVGRAWRLRCSACEVRLFEVLNSVPPQ